MKKFLKKYLFQTLSLVLIISIIIYCFYNKELLLSFYESFSTWLFPENKNRNGELFKIILSILGAFGILYGLYISLRRAKAIEEGVRKQGDAINIQNSQIELTRKAQTDERFKNAVEHLGNKKEPIILGGIAELNQIAKENKSDYSEIIFNILCSYIRSNTNKNKNTTVIQTIVNNLFTKEKSNPYKSFKADLRNSNFYGVRFNETNLDNADFSHSRFSNISNSSFREVDFSNVIVFFSTIENVDFANSKFDKTLIFSGTIKDLEFNINNDFTTVNFINTNIENVKFNNCKIHDWNFILTDIKNSTFNNTEIIFSNFSLSNFNSVKFLNVELFNGNDFRGAYFNKTIMKNIAVISSNFNGCRNTEEFNIIFMKEISKLTTINTSFDGLELMNTEFYKCSTDKLSRDEIDKILELYEKYEKIAFARE